MAETTATQPRLVGEAERQRITDISRSTWWRMERAGEVPEPVRVGRGRRRKWLEHELRDWVMQQAAKRRQRRSGSKK